MIFLYEKVRGKGSLKYHTRTRVGLWGELRVFSKIGNGVRQNLCRVCIKIRFGSGSCC